ncbi:MAG: hypothetical protein GF308_14745 [Candidatus Heimdallarchaeota archaeon]|nr:hypothetical protein [Candidatus Heimdallarchaeota archaeon]
MFYFMKKRSKLLGYCLLLVIFIVGLINNNIQRQGIATTREKPMEGVKVITIIAEGYDYGELTYSKEYLESFGVNVTIAGTKEIVYSDYEESVFTDILINEIIIGDYDCLVIPGGNSPEKLIQIQGVINLMREGYNKGLIFAAICHGPLVLAAADLIEGKNVTGHTEIRDELEAAGANYLYGEKTVIDEPIITANYPYVKEMCIAIVQVLDYFEENCPILETITVEPSSGYPDSQFTIQAKLSDEFGTEKVTISIFSVYKNGSQNLYKKDLVLKYEKQNECYSTSLSNLPIGNYSVNLFTEDLLGNKGIYEDTSYFVVIAKSETLSVSKKTAFMKAIPLFILIQISFILLGKIKNRRQKPENQFKSKR